MRLNLIGSTLLWLDVLKFFSVITLFSFGNDFPCSKFRKIFPILLPSAVFFKIKFEKKKQELQSDTTTVFAVLELLSVPKILRVGRGRKRGKYCRVTVGLAHNQRCEDYD